MKAFVPGVYPRSERLVQATRDLDRARTSQEAVDEQVERDLAELVSVQQQAGLDLLTDGMLRSQDIFRPLLEASEGLETGALTRFLDTNTFYRAPHATPVSRSSRASASCLSMRSGSTSTGRISRTSRRASTSSCWRASSTPAARRSRIRGSSPPSPSGCTTNGRSSRSRSSPTAT